MATVNQSRRTPGKWELRYQAEGKQRLRTFHSKKAADKARREIEHEIDMGIHAADADSRLFSIAARAFLIHSQTRTTKDRGDGHPEMRRSTVKSYTDKLESYAIPHLGGFIVSKLTTRDFEKWIEILKDNHKSSVVLGVYNTVFGVMSFCVKQGWIKRNILRDEPVTNLPKWKKRVNVPPTEQVHMLVDACERQAHSENILTFLNRRIFVYLSILGLRPSESFGLQWEDLKLEDLKIYLVRSYGPQDGLGPTKTEAGIRSINIIPPLYAALSDMALYWTLHDRMCEPGWRSYRRKTITTRLQDAWARRHDEQIAISPRTGFILLTKCGTPLRTNACTNFWGKLMRKAGLEDENGKHLFPPYSLRHHCASFMLLNGVNPLSTAKHMGHSRTSMTLDVYGHFLPGDESAREGVMLMSDKLAPRQLPPPEMPEDSRERKLTEEQVREIRAMIADGITLTRIAKDMKLSLSLVHGIKSGRRWGWLP